MKPHPKRLIDVRVLGVSLLACALGAVGAVVARALMALIALITNLSFYGRFSIAAGSPAGNHLGLAVLVIPVLGGLIVGLMARFGSAAIRGHGIPEAMEHVLLKESRIPARVTVLKPISAAIAIGTGGPFGAEGPIIATGGALGSLIGQFMRITADERRTLLAAGAAAGMAATFGSPVSAVLLAVELLLFEFSARSLLPVALASAVAAGVRSVWTSPGPMFAMPGVPHAGLAALAVCLGIGAVVGLAAVVVTGSIFAVEDAFQSLPIHWMWWPAIGAVAVGVVGWLEPRTLGVGYDNIDAVLSGSLPMKALLALCALKFLSWALSLGSGTSGGTLAPLFTIGGALGGALGVVAAGLFPSAGLDPRLAALVGMAALFAGASRAFLASVVFAFETTLLPAGIVPLLAGCASAYLVSGALMRYSIMTGKIARDGVHVPLEYAPELLTRVRVGDVASRSVVALRDSDTVARARTWLKEHGAALRHQAFPVLDEKGGLAGLVSRYDLERAKSSAARLSQALERRAVSVFEDDSLLTAVELMLDHDIGRLAVVSREEPGKLVGILTRSDVLSAYRGHFERSRRMRRHITFALPLRPAA